MKQTVLCLFAFLALSVAMAEPHLNAQTVTLKPSEAGLRVEIAGQLFTEYITRDTPRPFMYPLIGAAGVNVSRDFPMKTDMPGEERFLDHKHHRSLWFTHAKVNGINFWSEHLSFGKQEHIGFSEVESTGHRGSFLTATRWVAPTGETVLTDARRITITALPDGEKTLDFDITLQASEGDVLLGDTKEGTMAMRLCPSLSMNSSKNFVNTGNSTGHAFNSNGLRDHAIWGKPANWVCYHGPDPRGNPVGVAVFSHPGNLRSPTTWHARDYGLVAANPFGLHDFDPEKPAGAGDYTIKKGDTLNLRYRFYFAKGQPKPEVLNAKFQDYAVDSPTPPPAKPVTIVAFGDSTTAVRGSTTIFATLLQEELRHVRVINAGVGGSTTEMGRKRFETDVLAHQPQIAVIQFGINDAAVDVWKTPPATEPRVSLERYEANLRHFVQTLKSRDTRVVLMTPNPLRWTPSLKEKYGHPPYQPEDPEGFNALLVPYCEAVRQVAREEGLELLDIQQAFVEQAQKREVAVDAFLSDGMHPNDVGHRIEADLLREHILALAKSHGLPITEGPLWKASGEFGKPRSH